MVTPAGSTEAPTLKQNKNKTNGLGFRFLKGCRWNAMHVSVLTEDGEFLVGLQGLFPCEGKVEPACSCQVYLHGAAKHLHIRRSPLDGLRAHLHTHARHHHRAVVVDRFHGETARLQWKQTGVCEADSQRRHLYILLLASALINAA